MPHEQITLSHRIVETYRKVYKGRMALRNFYGYEIGSIIHGNWELLVVSAVTYESEETANKAAENAMRSAIGALERYRIKMKHKQVRPEIKQQK